MYIVVRKIVRFIVKKLFGINNYNIFSNQLLFLSSKILHSKTLDAILQKHIHQKATIIYLPTIDWNYLFQRPQQIALAFGEQNYLYFYCTSNINEDFIYGFKQIADNVYLTNQPHLLLEKLGLDNKTFIYLSWTINIKYIFQYSIPLHRVIYDYIDELDVFSQYGNQMINDHKLLVKEAGIVIATADKLYEEVAKVRSDCLLAPNAVNPQDFVTNNNLSIPGDIQSILSKGRKIIGYYGAMACWLDYELIMYLAQSCPNYEFVLIGPNYDRSKNDYPLEKYQNITWLGAKKYHELPKYARHFDVAIIPFLINKITNRLLGDRRHRPQADHVDLVGEPVPQRRRDRRQRSHSH